MTTKTSPRTVRLRPSRPLRARGLIVASIVGGISLQGCACGPADIDIVRVRSLGVMEQPDSIVGRDGGVSGAFEDKTVWVYGDSVATEAGTFPNTWRNNTMSWTTDLDASDGISGFVQPVDALGAPDEFFPRTPEEQAFNEAHTDYGDGECEAPCGARYSIWGSGPLADPDRDRYLLSYGKIYGEPGEFNFHVVGSSIAVWTDFDEGPQRPHTTAGLDDPTLLFSANEGEYGIPVIDGDDLYLFACSYGHSDSRDCRLARAPLEDVLDRAAWRFRTDDGWSSSSADAEPLFRGSPNMTVHYNPHVGRWLAFYMDWGKIVVRTAEELRGPWSREKTVYKPKQGHAIHALGHVELMGSDGRFEYISYLADDFRLIEVRVDPK